MLSDGIVDLINERKLTLLLWRFHYRKVRYLIVNGCLLDHCQNAGNVFDGSETDSMFPQTGNNTIATADALTANGLSFTALTFTTKLVLAI